MAFDMAGTRSLWTQEFSYGQTVWSRGWCDPLPRPFQRRVNGSRRGRPAFVIVEGTATTGPETIQQEYAKLAREILPKYAARYLARSQENTLLEGDGVAPCCMAILQFPNMDAVKKPESAQAEMLRRFGTIA